MKTYKIFWMSALLIAFGLAGCSSTEDLTSTTEVAVDEYESMDMDKSYGGLTFTDESADFEDAELMAMASEDVDAESDDPLQDDTEVAGYEARVLNGDPADPRPAR